MWLEGLALHIFEKATAFVLQLRLLLAAAAFNFHSDCLSLLGSAVQAAQLLRGLQMILTDEGLGLLLGGLLLGCLGLLLDGASLDLVILGDHSLLDGLIDVVYFALFQLKCNKLHEQQGHEKRIDFLQVRAQIIV